MMMEEQETIPSINNNHYQNPMNEYGGSILLLTDPTNELYKMELTLRSMISNQQTGEIKLAGEPLLNDLGINSVIGQVQTIVNQVTVMSNLSKGEIPMLIEFLGDTIAKDLMMNRKLYGIKNAAARDKIYYTVLTSSFICMKRAYEEGDKRFWKGSQQEITTRIEGEQKRRGVLSGLVGWGR